MQFPIEDMNNLNCWLSVIKDSPLNDQGLREEGTDPTLALKNLKIVMESIRLQFDCVECSSPKVQEIARTFDYADQVHEDVTRLANSTIHYITDLLSGGILQVPIDRMKADAPRRCPHDPRFESVNANSTQYEPLDDVVMTKPSIKLITSLALMIGVGVMLASIWKVTVHVITAKRHNSWSNTLNPDSIMPHKKKELLERKKLSLLDEGTPTMFQSPTIPSYIRFGVPIIILANIGFFMSGHISLAASIDIDAQIGGEAIQIKEVLTFSVVDSVVDMWEAKAKELAVLIVLFGIVWPYSKQFIVLFLWFAPTRITSVNRRESILSWLDALGKWSFIDMFVMIGGMPSFRVAVASPDGISFLPSNLYSLNMLLIPRWGLYSNMIAQLVSQFNSHLIIYYHRKIVDEFERKECRMEEESSVDPHVLLAETGDRPLKLCNHKFDRDGAKKGQLIAVRKFINNTLIIASIAYLILLLTGVTMPSFNVNRVGLLGLAVEASPGESSNVQHSVLSILQLLINQARFTDAPLDYIGLIFLSMIVVLTIIVIPIAQLGLLMYRWFGNLDRNARRRNFVLVKAVSAWQYVEVYILAIVLACWQLGSVSEFFINQYCGSLDELFNSLAYYGILRPSDAQCLKIEAQVQFGTWILVVASIMLFMLNHMICSAALQQETEIDGVTNKVLGGEEEASYSIDAIVGDDSETLHEMNLKRRPQSFSDTYRWFLTRQQAV